MDTQREAVAAEARSWLRTPYHHHARLKGMGVDCAQLLCAVYEACGLISPTDLGAYAPDWHLHRSEELFAGGLSQGGARPVECPGLGDIGLFRYGRCYSHGAIVVDADPDDPLLIHAYLRRGVIATRSREEPLAGREVTYWSLWG